LPTSERFTATSHTTAALSSTWFDGSVRWAAAGGPKRSSPLSHHSGVRVEQQPQRAPRRVGEVVREIVDVLGDPHAPAPCAARARQRDRSYYRRDEFRPAARSART
jgi:hypothetical protein